MLDSAATEQSQDSLSLDGAQSTELGSTQADERLGQAIPREDVLQDRLDVPGSLSQDDSYAGQLDSSKSDEADDAEADSEDAETDTTTESEATAEEKTPEEQLRDYIEATKQPQKPGQILTPAQPAEGLRGSPKLRPQISLNAEVVAVTLPAQPENPVQIIIDTTDATADTSKLNFDKLNWNLPQYVLVEPKPNAEEPRIEISVVNGERVLVPVPLPSDDDEDEDEDADE